MRLTGLSAGLTSSTTALREIQALQCFSYRRSFSEPFLFTLASFFPILFSFVLKLMRVLFITTTSFGSISERPDRQPISRALTERESCSDRMSTARKPKRVVRASPRWTF
jgi:hypothetical protein